MNPVSPLARSLDQELVALLRGASLECPVCGEFVLHVGGEVCCPECGFALREPGAAAARARDPRLQLGLQAG
jgi:hypothetical protein